MALILIPIHFTADKRSELSEDNKQCQLMTIKEEFNDEDFKMAEGFIAQDKNS